MRRTWKALGCGALVAVLPLAALSLLALLSYLREARLPEYDPGVHALAALERPGAGGRVLLLHGLAGSNAEWARTLEELPGSLDVLAPDLLGFGDSPKPRADYGISTHVRALDELLERKGFLDRGPVVAVGHSLGAIVALAWARERPESVRALVLVSLPAYESREQAVEQLGRVSWMHRGMVTRNPALKLVCYALHGRRIPFLHALVDLPPEVVEGGLEHNWLSVSRSLHNGILAADVGMLARSASVPVIFVHGTEDAVAPVANVEDLAVRLAGSAELIEIAGAGHELPLSHPQQVASQIARASGVEPGRVRTDAEADRLPSRP